MNTALPQKRPLFLAAAASLAALMVAGIGVQPAQADPTPVAISVTASAFAPESPIQVADDEFLFDSSKGEDATGSDAGYQLSYKGSLEMTTVWSSYRLARFAWMIRNQNDLNRWNAKTFSGEWNISFTVDPAVVSYNPAMMTCDELQKTIIEQNNPDPQNPTNTFGDIMRCDPADPNAVTYDEQSGQYTAKFRLMKEDGGRVTGADLDKSTNQPSQLDLTTPTGAFYVKQSAFSANTTFLMTAPRVNGEFAMDAFYIGMPVTFDATGNDVPLTMVTTHDTLFEFASTTASRDLPAEVVALLPARTTMHREGAVVTPEAPETTSVREGQGTWTFDGWSPETQTVGTADIVFVGNWSYTVDPDAIFTVTYGFTTDSDEELPAEVLNLLPGASTAQQGTVVAPADLTATEVVSDEGAWTFGGWSPASATVAGNDVTFTGSWAYTKAVTPDPKQEYAVSYIFVAPGDRALPAAVSALLPESSSELDGTVVTPASPAKDPVRVANGSWKFAGWSPASATVMGANLEFVGTWSFVPASTTKDPTNPPKTTDTTNDKTPAKQPDQLAASGAAQSPLPFVAGGALTLLGALAVALHFAARRKTN
ncbi:SHIRT domain-containing protein [Leucobacter sp. BZR 635]